MTDSASLKVDRAIQHIAEVMKILKEMQPFNFVVETDLKSGKRLLRIDQDKAAITAIAVASGDAIHNLRSALDHVFWEIVFPNASHLSNKQLRRIQFPFTSKADEFWKTVKDSYAHLAGTGFLSTMRLLRTHGENGGNKVLFLVRELDNRDKHKLLIPAVNSASIPSDLLSKELPDYGVKGTPNVRLSFHIDTSFTWSVSSLDESQLGSLMPPSLTRYKRKLGLPIEVTFDASDREERIPIIGTLHGCVDAVRQAIGMMREGATSY